MCHKGWQCTHQQLWGDTTLQLHDEVDRLLYRGLCYSLATAHSCWKSGADLVSRSAIVRLGLLSA